LPPGGDHGPAVPDPGNAAGRGGGAPPRGQRPASGAPDPYGGSPKTLGELGDLWPGMSFENIVALRDYSYGRRPLPSRSLESTTDYLRRVFALWDSGERQVEEGEERRVMERVVAEYEPGFNGKIVVRKPGFTVNGEPVTGSYDLYSMPQKSHPLTDDNGVPIGDPDAAVRRAQELWTEAGNIATLRSGERLSLPQGKSFFRFYRRGRGPGDPITNRIYVNASRERAPALMRDIVLQVVDDEGAYPGVQMAKIGNASIERPDSIVIYLDDEAAAEQVVNWLKQYQKQPGNSAAFHWEVPAMTEQVAPGISLGDEPPSSKYVERSFGSVRSDAIDRVLVKFPIAGAPDVNGIIRPNVEGFIGRVLNEFKRVGINTDSPHLNIVPPPAGGG
jgi:hypothetical protein